jgi:hypothetical protein
VVVLAAISASWFILFLGIGGELLMLATLPQLVAFRRHIDEVDRRQEEIAAAKVRAIQILQMDERHRLELERLDALAERTRDNLRDRGAAALLEQDWIGLDRLIAAYVRLSMAHKISSDSLARTSRESLAAEISSLEAMRTEGDARKSSLAERRLAIARRRAARWEKSRRDLDEVEQHLATIAALIHLLEEQSASSVGCGDLDQRLDALMQEIEQTESTIEELAELAAS